MDSQISLWVLTVVKCLVATLIVADVAALATHVDTRGLQGLWMNLVSSGLLLLILVAWKGVGDRL